MKARMVVFAGVLIAAGALLWGCSQRGSGPQTIKLQVTDAGFQPAEIKVHSGKAVTLLVTRTTDATCVKEIVIPAEHVRQELPLNKEVRITFTPERKGELRIACPMDMVTGSVKVE